MKRLLLILFLFPTIVFADNYTHTQFIDIFKEKDINKQIEVIKLQQARANVQATLGRIIPSLNLGTVVDTAVSGPVGLLGGLSNLLGFLMPSRWFTWNESKMYYLSQYHTYVATRGNLILMADELFLTLKKTYLINELLNNTHLDLAPLVKSIEFREKIGELPKGSSARVKTRLLALRSDILELENLINLYLIEMNKLIIDDSFSKITSIDYKMNRPNSSIDWNFDLLIDKSAELKALDALIVASKYSKKSRLWSFLDFSGEGFGLGYFARNKISTFEIEKIKLKKEQEAIATKAQYTSINEVSANIDAKESLYTEAIDVTSKRIKQILVDYRLTGDIDADDYLEILDNHLKFNILNIANIVQSEYIQAKKERLIFTGIYENLDNNIPQRDTNRLQRYQRREDRLLN